MSSVDIVTTPATTPAELAAESREMGVNRVGTGQSHEVSLATATAGIAMLAYATYSLYKFGK